MIGANSAQQDFWTEQAGPTWVAQVNAMDAALAPVLQGVLKLADLRPGEAVIDIGCGAGTSTFEAADHVGPDGLACGLDISETLLDAARARSGDRPDVTFVLADAQTCECAQTYDCLISRFGVMFFEDFAAAFNNMARCLRPGGRMAFATWGDIPANPFFTFPAGVAKIELGAVPRTDPDAPGPLALRDVEKVRGLLEGAGMTRIACDAVHLDLTPPGNTRDVANLMCQIGPAERALSYFETPPEAAQRFADTLAGALEVYDTPKGVRIPALINFFTARKAA